MHNTCRQISATCWPSCRADFWCTLAATALATAAIGHGSLLHHAAQAAAPQEFSRTLSAAGIPVTVLQSVPVSSPPALQATVQLRGMRAAAFSAQSTQLRFRQAVAQVLFKHDSFYGQVRMHTTRSSACTTVLSMDPTSKLLKA
jgi:hypothetical protein